MLNTQTFVSFDPDLSVVFGQTTAPTLEPTAANDVSPVALGVSLGLVAALVIVAVVVILRVPRIRNAILPFRDAHRPSIEGPAALSSAPASASAMTPIMSDAKDSSDDDNTSVALRSSGDATAIPPPAASEPRGWSRGAKPKHFT
jgi:hypothetical protein